MRLRTRELAQVNEQLQAENVARTAAELQLREADRRKDEFLATLAHELRNPLAPIRQAINVLAKSSDPAKQQKAREIVDRQAQRMALLLDDLLDDSRITRGRLILRKEPVSLAALIGSAVETVAGAVEERGHTLTIDLPAEPIEVEVDPLRLSQAVSNLLTNAVKYSPPGGKITLAVARRADQLLIRVGDTGVGFEPDKAASLFEMFSQSTPPRSARMKASGSGSPW